MKYNTQCWDDPTIQYFMLRDSSESKSENRKGSGHGGLNVRNKVPLDDEKMVEVYLDAVYVV